jgi:hypothetical protein
MKHGIILSVAFLAGLVLAACPAKGPKVPAACTAITEDNDASDHCSKDQADCEKTLSDLLHKSHENRCPVPPCTGFSAYVECTAQNQECQLGDGSVGLLFSTKEHIRCK